MTVVDRQAFERVYRAHFDTVLRYCLRRTTREDAMDAVVETFTVAWRRRESLPWERPLPWLYGVARRVLANQHRSAFRQQRVAARLGPAGSDPDPGPELTVLRAAEERALLTALESLHAADREVIRLAAWEGLSRGDVAAALGCTPNAATKRLNRALDRLGVALAVGTPARGGWFRRERRPA